MTDYRITWRDKGTFYTMTMTAGSNEQSHIKQLFKHANPEVTDIFVEALRVLKKNEMKTHLGR